MVRTTFPTSPGSSSRLAFESTKKLLPMRKEDVNLANVAVWIPDSKTPNGIAGLTSRSIFEPKPFAEIPDADWYRLFETNVMSGVRLSRHYLVGMLKRNWSRILFDQNSAGHHKNLRRTWQRTFARAEVPSFRIYDLRSTYATRLSAGGVADEWVTQTLRQGTRKSSRNILR
jgi:integrase